MRRGLISAESALSDTCPKKAHLASASNKKSGIIANREQSHRTNMVNYEFSYRLLGRSIPDTDRRATLARPDLQVTEENHAVGFLADCIFRRLKQVDSDFAPLRVADHTAIFK
jgi:hypothetical protein